MAPFLALTGFMGSGKSSVGARVAADLGWRFVDLDEEFCRVEGASIPEFFAAKGEAAFRLRERELLHEILERDEMRGLVVALGGGTVESSEAASMLAARGGVVFLDVEPSDAWARVKGTGRPLAADKKTFERLLARRRPNYESVADWIVAARGKSVAELAREIEGLVCAAGKDWQTLWGRHLMTVERSSSITGGKNALPTLEARAQAVHAEGSRFFVVTDKNVMSAWGDEILSLLDDHVALVLEPGEATKSVRMIERCWNWLAENSARRDDTVVALGGGVVGDLGGFAAATYQRGLSLWQIPTSLVAQVDSSVGGKTAVNLAAGKNMVGSFYQPDVVAADPATLETLPAEEYVGGLGEVVKHALLISASLFAQLEHAAQSIVDRDLDAVARVVKWCVGFKASVVEEDEREKGRRAILNLGHTTAHALEVVGGFGSIGHGHAVALGLLVSLAVSERLLGLNPDVTERTRTLLTAFGLPSTIDLPSVDSLIAASARDKKVRAGSSGFVGLRDVGDPVWGLDVPPDVLAQALEVIRK